MSKKVSKKHRKNEKQRKTGYFIPFILNIQLFRIWALYCNAQNFQFAYFQTNNNKILDLITINNCSNLIGSYTLYFDQGNLNISN